MALAARRVGEALDASVTAVFAVAAPAPEGARVVGFTQGGMVAAALVETERAFVGRAGAERALATWAARGEVPDAERLARTVAALVYPGCTVPGPGEPARGPVPALVNHPGGGRVLTFSFVIPGGRSGAGPHVARWRWTDSGLLIEASPHPDRR